MARQYLYWSDDEDQALRDGFAVGEQVAELMTRTPRRSRNQVNRRLHQLGLYRRPWGGYQPPRSRNTAHSETWRPHDA